MDGGWGMGAYLVTTTLLRASHALRFWILESWSEYNCDLEEAGLGLGELGMWSRTRCHLVSRACRSQGPRPLRGL